MFDLSRVCYLNREFDARQRDHVSCSPRVTKVTQRLVNPDVYYIIRIYMISQ